MEDKGRKKTGKVWLVGAGPSDPGLFTLKGKRVLEEAEVVVYDKLVGPGVLSLMPKDAKKINVGKIAGNHPIPQEKINEILLREALAGNRVVRLKGGDPFLFGRGGEELELLSSHGIAFEIVPGVTSALAVPAYNGIPVTHRDFCSSLHIITGHTKKSSSAEIDYSALVKLEGTLVFLMGVSAMPLICQGLMEAGMDPEMPAAILEKGTTAHQRRVVSTLRNLTQDSAKAEIKTPAIIVVGKVCSLEESFHWAEDRPLGHLKILITRPKERQSTMAVKLQELGVEVIEAPAIETDIIADNQMLEEELRNIGSYQWLAFTSPYGVKAFFQKMLEIKVDIRDLKGIKVAAIGQATRRAIEEKGMLVDLVPEEYYGADLGEALAKKILEEEKTSGTKIKALIPRAKIGSQDVIVPLKKSGLQYKDLPVYDTVDNPDDNDLIWYDETVDYVAFTSASTVRGFVKQNPDTDYTKVKALCIGKQTAKEAKKYSMKTYVSQEPSIDCMVELLLELEAR